MKLGEILKVKGGNAFKSQNFSESGIPLIRISNIKKDYSVVLDDCIYCPQEEKADTYKVLSGDILIAMSGATTGKVGRYFGDNYCYLNQRVGRFDIDEKRVSRDYIFQILKLPFLQHQVLIDAVGGAQPNISNKDIERIKVLLPKLKEQQQIAQVLSSTDQEIETLQQKLKFLKEEKKALMQQLLTGKRRVKLTKQETENA